MSLFTRAILPSYVKLSDTSLQCILQRNFLKIRLPAKNLLLSTVESALI